MVCGWNSTVPHSSGDSIIRQQTGWRADEKPVYLVLLVLFGEFWEIFPAQCLQYSVIATICKRTHFKPVLESVQTHSIVVRCEHAEHTENVFREQIWFGDLRGPDPAGER